MFLTNDSKCFEDCLTLETGLSDFHKLIFTIIKAKYERFPPKIANYRDYKNFDTKTFKVRLELTLKNTTFFEGLKKISIDLLNKFAPCKCKYLRANHSKFMTKELSKAIMLRTKFGHQFLDMKTPEVKAKCNKQRNVCVSLTRKAKRNYYESLDLNNICDNKIFWATVKPLFSNKIKSVENIVLSENGVLIKDEEEIANVFNNFFMNILPNLGINTQHEFVNTADNSQDPIEMLFANMRIVPVLFQLFQVLPLFLRLSQKRKLKN